MTDATVTGTGRIAAAFEAARDEGRAALMPYMMASYPDLEASQAVANAYAESADLVELGIPFSDPLADGPTIHAAATAALKAGASMDTAMGLCEEIAERVPVVFMVYANMVLAHGGAAEFARRALAAGACGAIVPDLPLEEAEPVRTAFDDAGLALVPLVAPTTPDERRRRICAAARGFVYVVSTVGTTVGTTGEREELPVELTGLVEATKAEAAVPIAVGFGIGTPEQAAQVGGIADGVIIGSRLVRAAGEADAATAVGSFLRETRDALASG